MSSPENIPEHKLVEFLPYPSGDVSPAEVTVQTATALDLYFSHNIPDRTYIQDYLGSETLRFIRGAQSAFLHNTYKVDRLGLASEKDMEMIERRRNLHKTVSPLDQEAFDYMLVMFSALPDFAQHWGLEKGFSRRGLLKPPSTVRQFLQRIDEMGVQMTQLAHGDISPRTHIETNPVLWRTKLFFEVGSEIPQYYKDNPQIISLKSQEIFYSMMQDNIDREA